MINPLSPRVPQAVGSALLLSAGITNPRDARAGHIVASGHSPSIEARVALSPASRRI